MEQRIIERSKLINDSALDKLKSSIKGYNNALDQLKIWLSQNKAKLMPDELSTQMEVKRVQLRATYIPEAKDFVSKFAEEKKYQLKKLAQTLYPLSSSEPSVTKGSERTAGEMQIQAAINLVQKGAKDKKHLERILDEIQTAMQLGRVDYISAIFNELNFLDDINFKNESKLVVLNQQFENEIGATERRVSYTVNCIGYSLSRQFLETVTIGKDYAFLPIPISEVHVFDARKNKSEADYLGFSGSPGYWATESNFS